MASQQRILSTRPCAWCETGTVFITTKTPTRFRATKRFCSTVCANAAGGITRPEGLLARMREASIRQRKAKAQREALALLERGPLPQAARRLYAKAYQAGWRAGKTAGIRYEHGRATREQIRARRQGAAA